MWAVAGGFNHHFYHFTVGGGGEKQSGLHIRIQFISTLLKCYYKSNKILMARSGVQKYSLFNNLQHFPNFLSPRSLLVQIFKSNYFPNFPSNGVSDARPVFICDLVRSSPIGFRLLTSIWVFITAGVKLKIISGT